MKDILVFTPVYRLEPETVRAIFALEWDGPLSVLLQRDNPVVDGDRRAAGYQNHLHQYQRGRETFLCGGYDAMLVIESDIVPPPDTLQRLAAMEADVAYGAYVFRGTNAVNILERYYAGTGRKARNMGEPLTVRGLWDAAVETGVVECSGCGLGCILIRRNVLMETPFEAARDGGFFDMDWTQAVYQKGYKMMADTGVRCGHIDTDGRVIWPREVAYAQA